MERLTILDENEVNKIKCELDFIRKLTYNIERDNDTYFDSYVIYRSVNSIRDHLYEILKFIGK